MKVVVEEYANLPVLEEALRRQVCGVCVNRKADGSCDLNLQHGCTLFDRLSRIAQLISRVRSEKIEDFQAAIRDSICTECFFQRLDGSCPQRQEGRCALDHHIVPVIRAIKLYSATASAAKPQSHELL